MVNISIVYDEEISRWEGEIEFRGSWIIGMFKSLCVENVAIKFTKDPFTNTVINVIDITKRSWLFVTIWVIKVQKRNYLFISNLVTITKASQSLWEGNLAIEAIEVLKRNPEHIEQLVRLVEKDIKIAIETIIDSNK